MTDGTTRRETGSRRHLVLVGLLAWIATLGVDLFFNAGVFAGVFFESSPFLLPPMELFLRIPLGYLSFLLLAGLVVWLMANLEIAGWRAGIRFGLGFGVVVHGAGTLGLASISTASITMLVVWFVAQTVQLGVVGVVVGLGLEGTKLRRLTVGVVVVTVVLVGVTVALQALELVPTPSG